MYYWYFKLFNNIKSEHEANELAKIELESLFGKVEPIFNFADRLCEEPLRIFMSMPERLQDYIIHELPYGKIQGYFAKSHELKNLNKLVKRLAYTREIYVVLKLDSHKPIEDLKDIIFSEGVLGKNFQYFKAKDYVCIRAITHQYFLEKSEYISKLSRNEQEIERNVKILFSYLTEKLYRIPASVTLSIGKRLEDYFTIREEPSLYLTHYFHPYKGKFHPKMVRALINYIYPSDKGILLDNFAGSGTSLVEAVLMELDSKGVEINPLSALMCNVKTRSLILNFNQLKEEIYNYFEEVKFALSIYESMKKGQLLLQKSNINFDIIRQKVFTLSSNLKGYLKRDSEIISQVLIFREILSAIKDDEVKNFLLLVLSGTISDVIRRKNGNFLSLFEERLKELYLRLFLFQELNKVLKINVGKSETYVCDARNMEEFVETEEIDGIVTSPPYSVALDYIKNDFPQLVLLELVESIDKLEKAMIGNPRATYNKELLFTYDKTILPKIAEDVLNILFRNGKEKEGLRSLKFFIDMFKSLKEMYRVLKRGSYCVIVIGNNHFSVDGKVIEIPNDKIILELASSIGFVQCKFIKRELEKSSEGNIKEESIIIMKKGGSISGG
ncbi:MAG: hypothetical protein ABIL49_01200 [candidate division WOR-3 bacterium]|jgi:DNA modification methylase